MYLFLCLFKQCCVFKMLQIVMKIPISLINFIEYLNYLIDLRVDTLANSPYEYPNLKVMIFEYSN